AVWSSACTSDTKVLFGENLPGSAEDRSESCYISTRDLQVTQPRAPFPPTSDGALQAAASSCRRLVPCCWSAAADTGELSERRWRRGHQADCSSTFSGQLWNELAIATNNAQTPTYIAVTLSKMDYLYPNGELVAYNAPPTLPASGVVPEAEYNTATGVCENALQSVALTILHDGLGSISSILAAMVATDVMLDSTTGWATLEQQHSIRFLVTAEASTARPKSGNPGYYPNFPVLAGTLASDPDVTSSKQAISRHIAGLPMPAPTTAGMCGVNSRESVKFGMNTLSTCTIPLTLPGLEQFCSGSSSLTLVRYMERVVNGSLSDSDAPRSSPPISVQLLDGLLYGGTSTNAAQLSYSQLTVYVGKWADADSTNLADWRDTEA
ncbi:hypothetical protein CYMTET_32166, partial [Cymbomonas tetramitiformis]